MKKLTLVAMMMLALSCNGKKEADNEAILSPKDTIENQDTKLPEDAAQDSIVTTESGSHSTDPIARIRQRVEHINTTNLEKKHFEFMCDEKMMVDYFYENGELVKVAVDFGTVGDVYAKEGYYYDNGKLVFNYEYTEGGPACEGCIEKNEYRTYIENDKAIRHIKNKNIAPCRTCSFTSKSRQYKVVSAKTAEEVKFALCGF